VSGTHETIETKRLVFEVSLLRSLIRLQGFRVRTSSVPGTRIILISRPACGSIITHNLIGESNAIVVA
jgi:hypothetical protein